MKPTPVRRALSLCLPLAFAATLGAQEAATNATSLPPDRFRIGTEYVGAGTFHIMLSGTIKGSYAVSGGLDAPTVSGTSSGDTILRADNQKIVVSADSGSTGQFAFTPAGYLGIGTTNPQRALHVVGPDGPVASFPATAVGPRDLVFENNNNTNLNFITASGGTYTTNIRFTKSGDSTASGAIAYVHSDDYMVFYTGAAERLRLTNTNRAGFNTGAPISSIHQYVSSTGNPTTAAISNAGGKDGLLTLNSSHGADAGGGGGILFGGYGQGNFFAAVKALLGDSAGNTAGDLAISTRHSASDAALTQRMIITSGGTVSVGSGAANTAYKFHVQGNAHFDGSVSGANIAAAYQDVAEWVPTNDALTAGTVVTIDRSAPNMVTASKSAYDTAVAGVVSEQPGIILGVAGPDKVRVATTGRVKVRADARYGAIAIGDLLVTSETPGVAMRSEPMTMNGRTFHQPGTLVGKALEPLEKGSGEILVLLSLQ